MKSEKVIPFPQKNPLGYEHVVCDCNCNTFHIETEDIEGVPKFKWLICPRCDNHIAVQITPCFPPKENTK